MLRQGRTAPNPALVQFRRHELWHWGICPNYKTQRLRYGTHDGDATMIYTSRILTPLSPAALPPCRPAMLWRALHGPAARPCGAQGVPNEGVWPCVPRNVTAPPEQGPAGPGSASSGALVRITYSPLSCVIGAMWWYANGLRPCGAQVAGLRFSSTGPCGIMRRVIWRSAGPSRARRA